MVGGAKNTSAKPQAEKRSLFKNVRSGVVGLRGAYRVAITSGIAIFSISDSRRCVVGKSYRVMPEAGARERTVRISSGLSGSIAESGAVITAIVLPTPLNTAS